MAEIDNLIRKRGSLKKKLSIFGNFIEPIYASFEGKENVSLIQIEQLKLKVEKIKELEPEFEEFQNEIELKCEEPLLDGHYRYREEFENKLSFYIAMAGVILSNLGTGETAGGNSRVDKIKSGQQSQIDSQVITVNNDDVDVLSSRSGTESLVNVRLPTIELPKYKGGHLEWLSFRDLFSSMIHDNTTINNIQKYHYLRASLEGEALRVIQALEFSSDNYWLAWDLLCKRFDNSKLLIHSHVRSLFELEPIRTESSRNLRNMIDTINKHLRSLESLGQPTAHWGTLLIYMVVSKLNKGTAKEWEKYKGDKVDPLFSDIIDFLASRAELLETLEMNHDIQPEKDRNIARKNTGRQTAMITYNVVCYLCKQRHRLYKCPEFLRLGIPDRHAKVEGLKLCQNCLCQGHTDNQCRSGPCLRCNKKHNRLLCKDMATQVTTTMSCYNSNQLVLLSTARVTILDSQGNKHIVKTLLDSGSQSCFMSSKLCNLLGVEQEPFNLQVVGINKGIANINTRCSAFILERNERNSHRLDCLVVPQITDELPFCKIDISKWKIPKDILLADDKFNEPEEIGLLIGASHFWKFLKQGRISLGKNKPLLQNSVFGYIISGSINLPMIRSHCNLSRDKMLSDDLQRFWEVEEVKNDTSSLSVEDIECEQQFISSVTRANDGRFIVKIPLQYPKSYLGESKHTAMKRYVKLEQRLLGNEIMKREYSQFMSEYKKLGHMSLSEETDDQGSSDESYYLPHHGVCKADAITTSLRIVFDGSMATSTGWSVNDIQFRGPQILNDIVNILMKFRKGNVVVSADVEKMYRQIIVHKNDRSLQKIYFRENPHDEIKTFELNTVTYGLRSSPYIAIRCLKQLSLENKNEYPKASQIIEEDFYMDDLITCFSSESQAIDVIEQVNSILLSAGFVLRKWTSNSQLILDKFRKKDDPINLVNLGNNDQIKTLGLRWIPNEDVLTFHVSECHKEAQIISKRQILSSISKLFDPLGLVSPCILLAKIIIQELWLSELGWDDKVPREIEEKWLKFREQMSLLNNLRVSRQCICVDAQSIEIHGFCDASKKGYAACIYIKSIDSKGNTHVRLVCAKTRVAPLKSLTIPRLELCGAVMLAKLLEKVMKSFQLDDYILWCDSQIVLSWIKTQTRLLQTFVSNRVAIIQNLTEVGKWHYVRSKGNPADLASRGALPEQVLDSQTWWSGPEWLSSSTVLDNDDFTTITLEELPETKNICLNTVNNNCSDCFSIERYSSLTRAKRVMAYVLRFVRNIAVPMEQRMIGHLTVEELSDGLTQLVKIAQASSFSYELELLRKHSEVNRKNKLLSLSPFLDNQGILRVGGRIKNAQLDYRSKHPILLNGKHWLSQLIFEHYHKQYSHAPPQLLLSVVRQEFWPTSGMSIAKCTVRKCIKCFKFKPTAMLYPKMADLPADRVTVTPPFTITGVDYAGPFVLRDRKGKGAKFIKSYISLFICFSSKAVHIEVISDLTTESFLAGFRRFVSRRGKPIRVYSDNGTNFVGANKELEKLYNFLRISQTDIEQGCATEGISWNFIPPNSPHFGGIWEANVRQFKHHLLRVMGETKLTYEEFSTITAQIEAILNSRPLYPMSSDPNDLQPLTPSHLLIGKSLIMVPDPSLREIPMNRLSRFQLLQRINQDFWRTWSRDYLNHLQQRSKWRQESKNIKVGTLVIIKDDNSPPCSWTLGRIKELFPDAEGTVRVVTITTPKGVLKRAVSRICPLPVKDNE